MTRLHLAALAFAAGFGLVSAAVLLTPDRPGPAFEAVVIADPAPWTMHRAGVLLAEESAEMRGLRAAGRLAQLDRRGPR